MGWFNRGTGERRGRGATKGKKLVDRACKQSKGNKFLVHGCAKEEVGGDDKFPKIATRKKTHPAQRGLEEWGRRSKSQTKKNGGRKRIDKTTERDRARKRVGEKKKPKVQWNNLK